MRTYAWVAAALAVALTTGCKDRDRRDADDRAEATAERAGDEIQEGADNAGDAVEDAANDVGDAAKDAADETGISNYTYDRRDQFRRDVRERLARIDEELAELRKGVNEDAAEAYTKGVAAARETRAVVGRDVDRLAGATAANWDELKDRARASLDSLELQLRALRSDAKPMGGTGPS